jgi:hypothetical protein
LVTVGGMLLVSLPLLISYLWSTSGTYQPFLEIIYNTLGFILFLTVGSLALDHYRNYAGVTHTGNDNNRGDTNPNNNWFGTTNSTWADSGIGKAFGWGNTTENANAGKALGVITKNFEIHVILFIMSFLYFFLGSLHHQRFLLPD